ncbi:MAG: GH92 family glycosyl hydrolase, partial [Thermoguttaceae bacterium]
AVTLSDYKIRTELTAAPRAGILRFTFPKSEQSRIQIDLARRVGGTSTRQFVKVVDANTIEGWMKCPPEGGGWGDGAGKADYAIHFSAEFSVPMTRYGVWSADIPAGWSRKRGDIESRRYRDVVAAAKVLEGCRETEGNHLGFYTEFATTENQQVLMKVGISFVSVEGARANLQHDISDWDFERVRREARQLWSHALAGVAIEGGSDAQKETFATALYHSFIDPRSFSDSDGLYTGADHKIHKTADYTYRTIFSGWDVYRSQYPLLTIIRPDVVNDTVNSLMQQAELSGNGYLARWEFVAVDSGCMIGDPAVSVITDAYLKGIRGYDVQRAYELCRQSVMGPKSSRQDLKTYIAKGFVPNSISWTLENCYCDYCAGRFAKALDKTDDARVLLARSRNYRNIYDPSVGNMRAKKADGTWTAWKGATVEGQGCVESNPYQQTWFVPHDVAGLIELMGKDYFLSYLTRFFEKTPASFQWNAYYNHSNEPVHHCVYLYTYAGQPWRTQQWARFTLDHAYGPGIRGLCGDEDVGQMSAWYLLSAIGIHPVSPVDGVYVIGSPLFSKVSVRLDPKYGGRGTFTVIAHNNSARNPYIQSAKLNGKPLERAWLYYREIVAGATLELVMGPEPNQTWGAAPAAAPPSLSDEKGRASVLLTSAVLAQQTASPPVREWPSMKLVMHRNLEYAQISGKSLTLDLYLPRQPKSPLPVLVWLHGEEGWFVGKYPSPIASMVGNEYAVASIDYRSASEAKFPAQLDDCKAAVRWLRANAEQYHLDVNHVGAWGWSDGGRLAVLLGTSGGVEKLEGTGGNTEQSSRVQAVVDFCGPASLEQDAAANPVRYASSGAPPILILHGDADRSVASGQSRSLDAALRKAGVKSTFNLVNGAGHDFKELRQGAMAEAVSQFLDEQLKGGAHVRFQLCRIDPPDDAWVDPIIDEPEGTHYKTFPAPTLGPGGEASYLIYLPPDYDKSTNTRYPVLYYLHGGGGSQRVGDIWVQKLDAAIRAGKIPPMISV